MPDGIAAPAPKELRDATDVSVIAYYDPLNVEQLFPLQEYTVYYDPPAFIMSPRIRLYRPEQIQRCRGYLSEFKVAELSDGQCEATVTIRCEPLEPSGSP